MDKIEQAREVSSRIWNAGYVDESATIDALIAELERRNAALRLMTTKAEANWIGWKSAEKEIECIKSQEPVAHLYIDSYGKVKLGQLMPPEEGSFSVYLAAGAQVQAQPVQQEPAAWEHCFVDPSKKILSYTKTCAGFPPRDDAYQINPLYAQPVQAQERKPLTDEQIKAVINALPTGFYGDPAILLARAIEAAHGVKEQP